MELVLQTAASYFLNMKREFSAGGIVFNKEGKVLITQHSSNHYWGFPKGHIEEGQTSKEAALREELRLRL